ncbi:flagellar hook-length control protein FliK [Alteromonas facilis]|uniref:flagellar hook-length control protein FliK n=1 Tax=Alteromonas facilis TaxID=2048004 RepID=UPI000C2841B9|nr:flagellar hook-length control protein FliK [Alteromonas facilis]
MQQIAPLQTDIAAKSDAVFEADKQWFASADNRQDQFGSLLGQERAQQERNVRSTTSERPNAASAKEKTRESSSTHRSEDKQEAGATRKDPAERTEQEKPVAKDEVAEKTTATAKTGDKTAEAEKSNGDQAEIEQPDVVATDSVADSPEVVEEEINWVDWIEQVKAINHGDGEKAIDWDGEIADLKALKDKTLPIEITVNEEGEKTITITLPEDLDLRPLDASALKDFIKDIVKQINQQEGDSDVIPNDLYISPVDPSLESLLADLAPQNGSSDADEHEQLNDALLAILFSNQSQGELDDSSDIHDQVSAEDAAIPLDIETDVIVQEEEVDELIAQVLNDVEVNANTPEIATDASLPSNSETQEKVDNNVIVVDVSPKKAIELIVELPEQQQRQAVQAIVEDIVAKSPVPVTPQQQQSFINALQAGIEEFKQQLSQGREPGLNLKAIISDAIAASSITEQAPLQATVSQVTDQVLQTLSLADAIKQQGKTPGEYLAAATRADAINVDSAVQTENQRSAAAQSLIDKPVNIIKPEGQTQFAEKIRWMVNARSSFAEIRLDPPDLGSVKVKVSMSGEAAQVNFIVQSPQARDALDQAIPRLKDMLNQQGIELGQSFVQQDSQQQQGEQSGEFSQGHADEAMEEVASEVIEQRVVNGRAGGIDFYA